MNRAANVNLETMESQERQGAIESLAAWMEKEKLGSVRTFPFEFTLDVERAISYAQAVFLVSRTVAQDLANAAFDIAHERYSKGLTA